MVQSVGVLIGFSFSSVSSSRNPPNEHSSPEKKLIETEVLYASVVNECYDLYILKLHLDFTFLGHCFFLEV